MKKIIKKLIGIFNYKIVSNHYLNDMLSSNSQFVLRNEAYLDEDGNFDYVKYKQIQAEGNKKKIDKIWVLEENIEFLSKYLENRLKSISFGICHGTRRGEEQKWFNKYLKCETIGTEISDTATDFPNTIQWDFHELNPNWVGKADFIYSNSFDHSYDPEKCLNSWISTLSEGGICILEHSEFHGIKGTSSLDPFGAELEIMPYLILKWGKGRFAVVDIIDAPYRKHNVKNLHFLVLKKV